MIVIGFDPGATTGWAAIRIVGQRGIYLDGGTVRGPEGLEGLELPWAHFVVYEHVSKIYRRDDFGTGMATALGEASYLAGMIRGIMRGRGIPSAPCSAAEWRKALVGKARASDAEIKATLMPRIAAAPARTNAHVRDAIGVALYGGLRLLRQSTEAA